MEKSKKKNLKKKTTQKISETQNQLLKNMLSKVEKRVKLLASEMKQWLLLNLGHC